MSSSFPKDWSISTIEDTVEILDNQRKPVNATERAKRIGNIPYYGATGLAGYIDDFIFDDELILLGEDGAPFFDKSKDVAFKINGKTWVNNHAHVLKAKKITTNNFLLYYLNQFDYNGFVGGTTRLKLTQTDLKRIPFPLPPLPEQERIVAKLDALFAQHESMKKALECIPQLLKDFRQQVLTHAITGKFTSSYEYQPIVQEIISDRKEWYKKQLLHAKPKKIVEKVNEDKSFLEFYLQKKTDISFIEEISAKKDNALKAGPFGSSLKKEFYVQEGYKIYGQEQVIKGDSKYGDYYIDEAKYKELQSCAIDKGDLLISLVGTIGKTLVIPADFEKGIINPRLLKFSFHEKINPYYIQIYLQSEIANKFLSKNSHGGTMDVLNMGILKKLPIPIPSTPEQQEIVSRVESLFSKAESIEKRYQILKEKIDNLPQAILHKAFKGELVPQLPTDGDAKDLLEEILKLKKEVKKK
ncbi:hypothetical protein CMU40_09385 [Elizabethkingia anophelis]|nr:hypothetical protein [Elizabethkingia anophelis]MDV3730437.1 hypothetical protein [Elizabethkingia anophelis]MDV3742594.1 hypothetical protein [Elizabethkingia anophelis]MDV3788650.1 hypothetical protein [Elizabethkingia anophelis]MDV3804104.1 hypothetical protein [Elizabethkingia anophelis]